MLSNNLTMSFNSPPRLLSGRFSKENTCQGGSAAFNTPYKSRNQSLYVPNKNDSQIKTAIKSLGRLLKQKWYIYHVSPLFNCNTSEVSMKRYARRLKEKLMSNLPDLSNHEYEVSYVLIKDMKLKEEDHDALEVNVTKILESGRTQCVYRAVLMSWGGTRTRAQCSETHLPILLCQGQKTVIKNIHIEFQRIHDCFINVSTLNNEELRILSVYVIANADYKADDTINLTYGIPFNIKPDFLSITLPSKVFSHLWSSIHESNCELWSDKEVATFWKELLKHTSRTFGLDLASCDLQRIDLPDVSFTPNSVQVMKRDQMHVVLCFLMNLGPYLSTVTPFIHEVVLPPL